MAFWLGKVALPAALVNALLNAWIGGLVYAAGSPVPRFGPHSAGADLLASAVLIGFFSGLSLPRTGALEARAGRVRGWGRARWLRALARRPLVGGLAFAVLLGVLVGLPTLGVLTWLGEGPLDRGAFLPAKIAYTAALGTLAALAAAFAGVLPEDDARANPRWHRGPAPGRTYPCQHADKGAVAISDAARGCSVTPTWQLLVRGDLDEAHLRVALGDLVARYPSLTTHVQALDGAPPLCRQLRYAADPAFTLDRIFEVIDLRGAPERLPMVEHELRNRPLDLYVDFPVTLSWLRLGEAEGRLVFRQHHGIADGRAFIELLADFAAYLDAARGGRRPTVQALTPVGRLDELAGIPAQGWRRSGWTLAGYGYQIAEVLRALLRPTTPLVQNRGTDYRGDNGTLHWTVEAPVFDAWQARRKALGVGLNSYLTAAIFLANRRWHEAQRAPVGRTQAILAVDTRPRGVPFPSFANHLGNYLVRVPLDRLAALGDIAASVQRQVERQRARHIAEKRLLCEAQVVRWLTLEDIHRVIHEQPRPLANLDFSNLIALDFPDLGGAGWSVEEVRITTPVLPRTGVVVTVIRYRGRVTFNFNYKSSAIEREQVAALLACFQAVLAE